MVKRNLTTDESLDGAAATAESMMANSATACRIFEGLVPSASNCLTIARPNLYITFQKQVQEKSIEAVQILLTYFENIIGRAIKGRKR